MMMKFRSIKFKVIISYILLVVVFCFIMWKAFYYINYYSLLYHDVDTHLELKAKALQTTIEGYVDTIGEDKHPFAFAMRRAILFTGRHSEDQMIEELEHAWLANPDRFNPAQDYVVVFNSQGRFVMSSQPISRELRDLLARTVKGVPKQITFDNITIESQEISLRIASFAVFNKADNEYYVFQIASPRQPVLHILKQYFFYIALSILGLLIVVGIIVRVFVVRTLQPVMEIARTASMISKENLSARVQVKRTDAEIKYLADAFNDMISRLEESFLYIAQFSSHVAHELKTPLAIIKGESELVLRKERDGEEYKRVVSVSLEQTERMLKTINDLLLLAKVDYKPDAFKFEELELSGFLKDVYEQIKVIASEKNIDLQIKIPQQEVFLKADALHLRRLFLNLLDNAVKYTPSKGQVLFSMEIIKDKVRITVKDSGVGIPKEDLPNIFRLFYRSQKSEHVSGHGVGLCIAQSIAKLHHGGISVESVPKLGSTFTVILPLKI